MQKEGKETMKFAPKHLQSFWNKKNILFVSLALIFALTVGVTAAWLSGYAGPTDYVFQGAQVKCQVHETFNGTTKSNVKVENTGNVDAFIRATYTVNWVKDGTGVNNVVPVVYRDAPQQGTDYTVTYGSGWVMSNDGYVYYSDIVSPEGFTNNFIANLTDLGTAPAGYHLQVTVFPEAVQAEGDGTTAYDEAWGATKNLTQLRPAANIASKSLESMVLTMNIRIAGDQYGDGTYAGDTGNGEWTNRRGSLAQYLRGSERDIICLQEVGQDQWHYLKDNVNNGNQAITYEFVYWSFDSSQTWYRGLMTMFDVNRYEYVGYELVYLTEDGTGGKVTYDDGCGNNPYHYRGALITRLREKATGVVIAVCNIHTDYPADNTIGVHDCTSTAQIDRLREIGVNRALTRLYAQDADFHIMAGDFNADAYRNPNWYNTVTAKMQDVLPGETTKTLNDWDNRGYLVYQKEGPSASDVNGPTDFIFVDKNTQIFREITDANGNLQYESDGRLKTHTQVHIASYNYGADLYSRHYAVYTKARFTNQ